MNDTRQRRIKTLTAVSVVLLPVTVALYYLLPNTPAAGLFVGLLWGFGASIPIGIMLALVTERQRQRRTTVIVSMPDGQHCAIAAPNGATTTIDLLETFGPVAMIDAPGREVAR